VNNPYLGRIPPDIDIRRSGDEGRPFVGKVADSPAWKSINDIIDRLLAEIESA